MQPDQHKDKHVAGQANQGDGHRPNFGVRCVRSADRTTIIPAAATDNHDLLLVEQKKIVGDNNAGNGQ